MSRDWGMGALAAPGERRTDRIQRLWGADCEAALLYCLESAMLIRRSEGHERKKRGGWSTGAAHKGLQQQFRTVSGAAERRATSAR
eukprot:9837638-Alexandrium_andersonii.AAC.1